MRIRLEVRRQNLPSVKLLWTTTGLRPGGAGPSRHATFAQLLEQVNEIVPLEVGAAGLENYVVEVGGYECLHFCNLDQILQEDDEVTIRPLEFTDVRSRRISGRHQISADGRHLIDGVAFGRPFLRPHPRSGVFDAGNDDASDPTQLLLGASENLDADGGDSDGLERESYSGDLSDTDLSAELEGLAEESRLVGRRSASMPTASFSADPSSGRRSLKRKRSEGLGIGGAGLSSLLRSEDSPNGSLKVRKRLRRKESNRLFSGSSNPSVRFAESEQETPATIRLSRDSATNSSDEDYQYGSGAPSSSDKENHLPSVYHTHKLHPDSELTSSSGISTSNSDSDSTESESGSDSDSSSRASRNYASTSASGRSSDGSHSESDSSSRTNTTSSEDSTSSDDSPPSESHLSADAPKARPQARQAPITVANSDESKAKVGQTPPGAGQSATTARNKRRRESQRLVLLKDAGILPQGAALKDSRDWYNRFTPAEAKERISAAFEAKRQQLLDSIAGGGVSAQDEHVTSDVLQSSAESKVTGVNVNHPRPSLETQKSTTETAEDGSWRDQIVLTAVECCGPSRRLSTPPFPFIQRWHQKNGKKKGVGHKRFTYQFPESYEADVELDYGDAPAPAISASQQPGEDNTTVQSQDLPELPKDLTSLPMLETNNIKPEAVIVFKRMEMSKATNWNPIISDYQTARVKSFEDGFLTLELAQRDIRGDEDKEFDPLSGQRLYSGFEAPDMDDEVLSDPSRLEVQLTELIDPRLLLSSAGDSNDPDNLDETIFVESGDAKEAIRDGTELSTRPDETVLPTPSSLEVGGKQGSMPATSKTDATQSPLRRSTRTPNKSANNEPNEGGSPLSSKAGNQQTTSTQDAAAAIEADDDNDGSSVASGSISLSSKRKRADTSTPTRKSSRLTRSNAA